MFLSYLYKKAMVLELHDLSAVEQKGREKDML